MPPRPVHLTLACLTFPDVWIGRAMERSGHSLEALKARFERTVLGSLAP
ncbi:MAG: hypothetical protein AB1758_24450 [Candidatus Eremiobacterota bacterium]